MRTLQLWTVCIMTGFAVGSSASFCVAAPSTLDPQSIYRQSLGSVLTLVAEKPDGSKAVGTAFMAIRDGLAVTAWHVVRGASHVTARAFDGEEFDVSGLVDLDEKRDVAIVRVKAFGRPLLVPDPSEPNVGSRVYAIGAPKGLEFSLSEGLVSQWQVIDGRRLIQYTCASSPGNSGGPLLDVRGRVVGVVAAQMREGQNLNFAVPIAAALALDTSLPTQPWQVANQKVVGTALRLDDEGSDRMLGRALCAMLDIRTALDVTGEQVVRKNGGFQSGIPPYLYRFRDDAVAYAESLGTLTTDDLVKERARQAAREDLTGLVEAAGLLMAAIQAAQAGGGWGTEANDKLSHAYANAMKELRADASTLSPLMASSAFRGGASTTALILLGLLPDSTDFRFGVRVWTRDGLSVVSVAKGSWAERLGLKVWDTILQVNNKPVRDLRECKHELLSLRGQSCWMSVMRRRQKTKLSSVKLPLELGGR